MTDDERADLAAGDLLRAYAVIGQVALIVRTVGEVDIRLIAPDLNPEGMAAMLRLAADSLDGADEPDERTLQ